MSSFLRVEPSPEDIVPCDDCPFAGSSNGERVFSSSRSFLADLDQYALPRDQQVGVMAVELSLLQKATIDSEEAQYLAGKGLIPAGVQRVYVLKVPSPLDRVSIPVPTWEEIKTAGCQNPEPGKRRLRLWGKKETLCPVVESVIANRF